MKTTLVALAICLVLGSTTSLPTKTRNARFVGGSICNDGTPCTKSHVQVYFGVDPLCAGTLIAPAIVLTTASCVFEYESQANGFKIRYGSREKNKGTLLEVTRIDRYPSYNPVSRDNDLALLHLAYPFTPGKNAAVISLASVEPRAETTPETTGYASANWSWWLHWVRLSVKSKSECQARWGSQATITDGMLCAHNPDAGACSTEIGEHLIDENGKLVGMVSWGPSNCPDKTLPMVFTNVAHYKSWIESKSSPAPKME